MTQILTSGSRRARRTLCAWGRVALLAAATGAAACASTASRPGPPAPDRYANIDEYLAARQKLIAEDRATRMGAALSLTPAEEAANRRLLTLKEAEFKRTRGYFPPAHSFLDDRTKRVIAESPVFEVMKHLPKGGLLHVHGGALGDFRWLVSTFTYRPDCYMYVGTDGTIPNGALRIFAAPPGEGWRTVIELRAAAPDVAAFDERLYRSITFGEDELKSQDIWHDFSTIFRRASGLTGDPSLRAEYWRNTLLSVLDDNIQYVESRSSTIEDAVVQQVRTRDPEFTVKFIAASERSANHSEVAADLAEATELRLEEPDRMIGIDFVEEEDRTNSNLYYVPDILAARQAAARRGVSLPLYLHSGETNWTENENVYDAVLLGAVRIGHGLALFKHPRLMEIVKARGIAVEVCPISNQLLGYVSDLRTHPAILYMNAGLPIVLSTDDPAIFRQTLSHDYYEAFMAWGLDLRSLKQLAMNSLLYSAMDPEEKRHALAVWEQRWATFIAWLNQQPESGAGDGGSGRPLTGDRRP